ncbi:MAG: protein kinase domain-containing protein [Candidatus Sulfotelmatobacter sp.]
MIPEHWQQVKAILHEALQIPAGQRASFLDSACNGDQVLRQEIESLLLEESAGTEGFLRSLDLTLEDARHGNASWAGRRIGSYEIIGIIGEGGMGSVYRAARADELYQKQVAIKIVKLGLDTPFALVRFRAERQILANLEHPNIARLLDGGTTEDGLPYVVMELVEGQPIDQYCETHRLSIDDRLRLFRNVCLAVQYAHQHLVVHRDLKPGNILVTADGTPKLLDFGIAKILDADFFSSGAEQTVSLMRMLTPEFASPEQVRGDTVTTASDVYSLGVILFGLLTGRSPYEFDGRSADAIVRAICETESPKPSTAARRKSATGNAQPAAGEKQIFTGDSSAGLSKRLRGDLDNIVSMALRKDPHRRYASTEQFAEDIRRHLENLPVTARTDTVGYRASKFLVRHRVGSVATTATLILLIAALLITLRQASIARRRFNDVRTLANSMVFDIHDAIQDLPGSTPARKLIVQKGLQYLDNLAQESNNDPSLQRELAAAYDRIGDVQGLPFWANLGDTAGALQSYKKALGIRQQLAQSKPRDLSALRDLATGYEKMDSILESMGKDQEALNAGYQALAIREKLVATEPRSPVAQHDLASCHNIIASALWDLGDLKGALQHYKDALDGYKSLASAHPESGEYRRMAAVIANKIASVYMNLGDSQTSVEFGRQAVTALDALASADAMNTMLQRNIATAKSTLGFGLIGEGDTREARTQLLQAAAIDERLSAKDPENVRLVVDLSLIYTRLGDNEVNAHRGDAALRYYRQALQKAEREASKDPLNAETQWIIPNCYRKFGEVYEAEALRHVRENERRTRCLEAQAWLQKALQRLQVLNDKSPPPGFSKEINEVQMDIAKCEPFSHSGSGTRPGSP